MVASHTRKEAAMADRKTMKQEQVALFRYAVIFPLLDERLGSGEQERLLDEIAAKDYEIPFTTRRKVCRGTARRWLGLFRKGGIEALYPKGRSDKGTSRTLDVETLNTILATKREHPDWTVTAVVRKAEKDDGTAIPIYSAYRALRDYDFLPKDGENMRRFEMECCNDCWMLDAMHGPKVRVDGEGGASSMRKSYCFAFIDDKSRLITHAEFYLSESGESLLDCMWKAFNRRGLPVRIFTDNGSAMRDTRLQLGLADLEVQLSYSTAYRPQGKAKIERFWRTLRMQFLPTLPPEGSFTLYELNRRLDAYVDTYNKRFHHGIGMSPLERYMGEVLAVRPAPMDMPRHFRFREERTVSAARTVSLGNRLYEVPLGYTKKRLELRYFNLDAVEAYFDGKSIGFIEEVNLTGNASTYRGRQKEEGR